VQARYGGHGGGALLTVARWSELPWERRRNNDRSPRSAGMPSLP
jgi:hypothetical protein